jgi:hypothetical protein
MKNAKIWLPGDIGLGLLFLMDLTMAVFAFFVKRPMGVSFGMGRASFTQDGVARGRLPPA